MDYKGFKLQRFFAVIIIAFSVDRGFMSSVSGQAEEPAVSRFREYLRLKSVLPDPDYASAIDWIKNQAEDMGLEYNILEFEQPNLFTVWLTWPGTNQTLPSILLNSHIDVVPVDEAKWTHDPFAAEKDEVTGNIYGRGAQDMKSIGVQYLEAIRNLKAQGLTPLRNVHISFVPDEENGGAKGMAQFVQSVEFQNLNVGFALDEGFPSPTDEFSVIWAERASWKVLFTAQGHSGHGSILHEDTAAEKVQKLLNLMLALRTSEKERMEEEGLELGDVTTINLTTMKGGEQLNVVPAELFVGFDIRVTPYWNLTDVVTILDNFSIEAGPNVTYEFIQKSDIIAETVLNPENIWWTIFQSVAAENDLKLHPAIHPAATDIRYIRELGIPAFGFTPAIRTPLLAHDHDEFLNENVFLEGIQIYEKILPRIFNQS